MKSLSIFKVAVLLSAFTLLVVFNSNAQQIEETQLKTNIDEINNPVAQLKQLKPVTYTYNTNKFKALKLSGEKQFGVLASSADSAYPDLVESRSKIYSSGKNNTKVAKFEEVDLEKLVPVLLAAIKEQQQQIEQLQIEVDKLKSDK